MRVITDETKFKYVGAFSFQVLDLLADGKDVQMLDRKWCKCMHVSEIVTRELVKVLNSEESGRYEFWYTEIDTAEEEKGGGEE